MRSSSRGRDLVSQLLSSVPLGNLQEEHTLLATGSAQGRGLTNDRPVCLCRKLLEQDQAGGLHRSKVSLQTETRQLSPPAPSAFSSAAKMMLKANCCCSVSFSLAGVTTVATESAAKLTCPDPLLSRSNPCWTWTAGGLSYRLRPRSAGTFWKSQHSSSFRRTGS